MPRVKVDYELITDEADPFIKIQEIIFDATGTARANLSTDRIFAPKPGYKSDNPQPPCPPNRQPYWILPDDEFVNVFVRARGVEGMSFSMTVTFTILDKTFSPVPGFKPFTPDTPKLTATIGEDHQGFINTQVRWVEP